MSTNNIKKETIVKFKDLDDNIQKLLREAVDVRNRAYTPYSKFNVGASLQCADGTSYKGCNVENGAFTVGICAERTAYVKAVSEGKTKFKKIAIIADQKNCFTYPCGACRQFMSEFGKVDIYCSKPNLEDVCVTDLDLLLPHQFSISD